MTILNSKKHQVYNKTYFTLDVCHLDIKIFRSMNYSFA